MILIPNALFCLLLPPKLVIEKHAALACMMGSLACLVAVRFTEPGILPAAVDIDHDAPEAPVTHVLIGGKRVPLADRRARYSRYTDVIVARLDHYCSWIGSPVGARNHFYYCAFLLFSSLDVAIMGPASALRFQRLARSKHSIERVSPLFVVGLALLGCYCFGVLVWTGSLLVDQAGLIARNETSIERVKKTWRGRANPHNRGAFRNWLDFCFRATPSVVLELDQVESRCEA